MAKTLVLNIFLVLVVLISLGTHALNDKGITTFPLYHREKFMASHFMDHHSLVLARLARDRARFKHLQRSHLQHSNSAPFLRPNYDFNEITVFEEGGEYVTVLKVGTPAQKVQLLVDIGTPFTWWQCQPGCTQCYSTPHHIFDASMSSTYTQTDCFNGSYCDVEQLYIQGCVRRGEHQCHFSVHYVDGSVSEGIMATETISTDEGVHLSNNFSFGCGRRMTGVDMFKADATGILGFVPGGYSFPSQLQANKFTFCLPYYNTTDGGALDLNYYAPRFQHSTTAILDIRMDHYYLKFSGIEMNEEVIPVPPEFWECDSEGVGGVIIDTGTTISKFPEKSYDIFKDYFIRYAQGLPRAPREDQLDTCFYVKSVYEWTYLVPKVKFLFKLRTTPLELEVGQLLMPVSDGKYCLAFAAGGRTSIIGSWQLQGSYIGFDLPNHVMGIQPGSCYH